MLAEILQDAVSVYVFGICAVLVCFLIAYAVSCKQHRPFAIRPRVPTLIIAVTTWPIMVLMFGVPLLKSALGGRKHQQKGKP